ncbi:MAG: hypothetical protein RL701_719 [Pseudomonadota bacterium]
MKRLVHTCLLATTVAAGCSSTDTATEADYDDVAQSLSAVVTAGSSSGDIGAMFDATTVALGASEGLTFGANAQGAYSGNSFGLNYTYKGTCHDAAGALLAKCGSSTDDATIAVDWDGELSVLGLTASVERNGSWQLKNIQSSPVELSGTSEFTLEASLQSLFRNATRTYHLTYEAEYAGVELDRVARRIQAGTVHYSIDAERTVATARRESEANFHMDGVLTFTGDGKATLTLDKSFTYKIDPAKTTVEKME